MKLITRTRFLLVGISAALVVGIAVTVATFAGASTTKSVEYKITSGVPVGPASFSAQGRWMLDEIGVTGSITKVGDLRGVSFYEGTNEGGAQCFMAGSTSDGGGLYGGCLRSAELDQPLIDMSSVCIDPATGDSRLARIEGIAVDGISAVAVIDEEGAAHVTPVLGNVYKMASGDIPSSASCPGFQAKAIVALDENGSQVFKKTLIEN